MIARVVTTRATWEAAVQEAIRMSLVCREKFGPGEPHLWRYRVRRRRAPRPGQRPWVIYTPTGTIHPLARPTPRRTR